jgi:hypothetical protein
MAVSGRAIATKALARQDAFAADFHRPDRDDVVHLRVEARRLAIEGDDIRPPGPART